MFGKASDNRATDYESYMQAIDDYESAFKVQVVLSKVLQGINNDIH